MNRLPHFFVFSGIELARFFALVTIAGRFTTVSLSASHILRLVTAPNVLFVVAFIFMGIDAVRYESYRPLVITGKLVAVLSAALALLRLMSQDTAIESDSTVLYMVIGILLWDTASTAYLLFSRRASPSTTLTTAETDTHAEPEQVEME
jgi:hypothetical protein